MEYSCISINNDVREYRISRKDTSIVTYFDIFLLFTLFCTIIKHQFYNQSLFKSFSTYILLLLILFRIYLKFFIVKEESLIVMRELGVQLRKKYILRPQTVEFIEKTKIEQIVINEGITKHNVIFYMAFIVNGKNKMVLAFEDLIPRIHILLKIYKGTMSFIYNNSSTNIPTATATATNNIASNTTTTSTNININNSATISDTLDNNINNINNNNNDIIDNFHLK